MTRRAWIALAVAGGITLLAFAVIFASALGSVATGFNGDWPEENLEGEGPEKVVVIDVTGEIVGGETESSLFGTTTTGSDDVIDQLRQAEEDDGVAAVIVRLDTPGGEVVASDDVYREIRRVSERKPVLASMGDLAASGGYYIASATRHIVASPSTWTGSIGVIAVLPNVEGLADKVGVRATVVKSGAFKDAGSPLRALTPEERAYFQQLIDEAYRQFVEAVAKGRGKSADEVRPLADGRIFSGLQAKENGLVDELGDLETAYDAALKLAELDRDDARLVQYGAGGSIVDFLSARLPSPARDAKRELGLGFGAKYLFLPGA